MTTTRAPGAVSSRRQPVLLVVVLLVVVGVGVACIRLWTVHDRTWAWSLTTPQIPPRTEVGGRHYLLGSAPSASLHFPARAVRVGTTEGGAPLYREPTTAVYDGSTPTVLWAVDSDGRVWGYALSGGP